MGVAGGFIQFWHWRTRSDEPLCALFFRPPLGLRFSSPTTHSLRCGRILAPLCGLAEGGTQIGVRRNPSAAKAVGFVRSCGMAEAMPSHGLIDALRRSETAGSDCQRSALSDR